MSEAGKLLTVAQAAELSACSTKTLRRAIDAGQLQACRLGQGAKSDRIHPNDLEAWWALCRVVVPQPSFPEPSRLHIPLDTADERIAKLLGIGGTKARTTTKSSTKKTASAKRQS